MFEVQDLAVASPATVSRCGMVYLEPSILGLRPFVNCWLKNIPNMLVPYKEQLLSLFDRFLQVYNILWVSLNMFMYIYEHLFPKPTLQIFCVLSIKLNKNKFLK